jgi:hypothetical protein
MPLLCGQGFTLPSAEPGIFRSTFACPAGLHRSGDGSGGKMRVKATGGGAYKYAEVSASGVVLARRLPSVMVFVISVTVANQGPVY